MTKPIWKGNISFGLVNIPVVLHSAEKSNDLHFKLIDSRNNSRIHYQRINEETGKEVPWNAIAHGYEIDKGNYVLLSKEDFNKVASENLKSIEIEEFIPSKELDCFYFVKPYYVFPDGKGSFKGYALLREILKQSHKIGIARVMIRTRQHIAAIIPYGEAIVINILRYPHEIKKPTQEELPTLDLKAYKISKKETDIALQLVEAMSVHWDPKRYHDEYHDALLKWIEEKAARGQKGPAKKSKKEKETKQTSKVVDFMELLKKSVKEKEQKIKERKHKSKSSSKPAAKSIRKLPRKNARNG